MNTGTTSKFTAIAVGCLSLGMYALAQKAGGPSSGNAGGAAMQQSSQNQSMSSQQQNQSMPSQQNLSTTTSTPPGTVRAQSNVKTSPTPRGHHYGWQKGRHNPHRMNTSPSVAASAAATSSPNPTANPKETSPPPVQSP